ncbi:hypothetical protein EXIGLDRAFT_747935 [Exidia glandulosa HHB12029]|uniref:Uncharacterized protein n=1 Tax=Exidia glandulosa HHB12029 TaxID=1314781 RepID=A0A165K6L4_EXIGL|nr:hypothetical protein EXIGLDRAFT_747935 [Exidia glandulosa HHB12029]
MSSTRAFAVFVDENGAMANITNSNGALRASNPLKKSTTLTTVADANEKENIDPLTGLSTTTHALASVDRPSKKRKLQRAASASGSGALATTAIKGRPVVARARSENALAGAGAVLKKRKTMQHIPALSMTPAFVTVTASEPARTSSFMSSLLEDADAQADDAIAAADAAQMAVDQPAPATTEDAASMDVTCDDAPAITADNNTHAS